MTEQVGVTRYDIESTPMIAGLSPCEAVVRPDGEYVRAADYLALRARYESSRGAGGSRNTAMTGPCLPVLNEQEYRMIRPGKMDPWPLSLPAVFVLASSYGALKEKVGYYQKIIADAHVTLQYYEEWDHAPFSAPECFDPRHAVLGLAAQGAAVALHQLIDAIIHPDHMHGVVLDEAERALVELEKVGVTP